MKTLQFDDHGNLTVIVKTFQEIEGGQLETLTQYEIQPHQLEQHLPMFEADMSADILSQAQALIAAQHAEAASNEAQ